MFTIVLYVGLVLFGIIIAPLCRGIFAAWLSDVKKQYDTIVADLTAQLTAAQAEKTGLQRDVALAEAAAANIEAKVRAEMQVALTAAEAKYNSVKTSLETLTGRKLPDPVAEPAPNSPPVMSS